MPRTNSHWRAWALKAVYCFVLGASISASYAGASLLRQPRPDEMAACFQAAGENETLVNPFASANGTHLIAFVVTASDCGWSTLPAGIEAIRSLRAEMNSVYGDSYAEVRVVGVALDSDLDAGLRFLADIGRGAPSGAFDQVIVGGSWLNEQIVRFVWRERIAQAATPQIVVVERKVDSQAYLSSSSLGVEDDTVVANPAGAEEVVTWLKQGMPLGKARTSVTSE